MKKCSQCQQVKTLNEFSKKDGGKTGAVCKVCAAEKQRQWYEDHKDEISLTRSTKNLTRSLNILRRKAKDAGYKINVIYEDQFIVTMEKL